MKVQVLLTTFALIRTTDNYTQIKCPLKSLQYKLYKPVGNECDFLCVKAPAAQCLSSSDHQSPDAVASRVLQIDSLLLFLDL